MFGCSTEVSIQLMADWSNELRATTSESPRCSGPVTETGSHRNRSRRLFPQSYDWHQIHFVAGGSRYRSDGASLEMG